VTRGSSNESDNSTDSDEELDSPKSIPQQPAGEKMDVDQAEGMWGACIHKCLVEYECNFVKKRDTV